MSSRRHFLVHAPAAVSFFLPAAAQSGEEVINFADTKPFNPARPLLPWEQTTSWITPDAQLFRVGHYGIPQPAGADWSLEVTGFVQKNLRLTLADIRKMPRKEHTATLECSGNGPAGGLIGNARWAGTPLAGVLKQAGLKPEALEAVFFGVDQGTEKIRGGEYPQQFARSLSIKDSMLPHVLLCYEMNGAPLTNDHGAPVRLAVPGWYGVAWVKWLTRIEIHDRHYLGRFTGRDYVTIRGEQSGGKTIWRETSVGRMNLKSVVARLVRKPDAIHVSGAAWGDGTPIQKVEVRVDEGAWTAVSLDNKPKDPYTWRFWSYEWKGAQPGEHTIASRATDAKGRVQPAPGDPFITLKKTYWEANQQAVRKFTL
jgi:DMSO/TMAO reductase YedYZ molybdopterin-dependent catalytic subunit